ncbi:unnamed protein product [Thlaspi arvense]|uniref:Uncharacterized protein n=1 Tax=Thlaspi arvense TaxID=13288 RepID=A0AAU9RAJ4_THLAR|nr:unnamed protein product [Thlaspi arvense]
MQVLICDLEVVMRSSASLSCDKLTLSSQFGYERAVGTIIRNMEIALGDVSINLDEDLFSESKKSSASVQEEVGISTTAASSAKKPQKEHRAKYLSSFPEKVRFPDSLVPPSRFPSAYPIWISDVGESTRLDVQMELSEIHV